MGILELQSTAGTVGLVLGVDLHRSTAYRWEELFEASLRSSSKEFFKESETLMAIDHPDAPLRTGYHCIRSDATNAKVLNRKKLHMCEISSCYSCDACGPTNGDLPKMIANTFESTLLADALVYDDCSGAGCYRMLHKQTSSVGAPSFHDAWERFGLDAVPSAPASREDVTSGFRKQRNLKEC